MYHEVEVEIDTLERIKWVEENNLNANKGEPIIVEGDVRFYEGTSHPYGSTWAKEPDYWEVDDVMVDNKSVTDPEWLTDLLIEEATTDYEFYTR